MNESRSRKGADVTKEPLEDRRKALEEAFFKKENDRLLAELHEKHERDKQLRELALACGFEADEALKALVDLGISASTFPALSLVPLIQVAWADGNVSRDEREKILEAAQHSELEEGSPCSQILDTWLASPPPRDLFQAWLDLTREIASRASPDQRAALRDDFLTRAKGVAKASGGIVGIGSISAKERAVLDAIEAAF